MRLALFRVPGESPGEVVLYRGWRTFSFWVKHEYGATAATATEAARPAAPWEWIIVDGRVPIAFGDEPTQAAAELALCTAVAEICPTFEGDAAPEHSPGLLRRLWRAI
jgi:hypothetical protein